MSGKNLTHLLGVAATQPDQPWIATTDSAIEPGIAEAMLRDAEREARLQETPVEEFHTGIAVLAPAR